MGEKDYMKFIPVKSEKKLNLLKPSISPNVTRDHIGVTFKYASKTLMIPFFSSYWMKSMIYSEP